MHIFIFNNHTVIIILLSLFFLLHPIALSFLLGSCLNMYIFILYLCIKYFGSPAGTSIITTNAELHVFFTRVLDLNRVMIWAPACFYPFYGLSIQILAPCLLWCSSNLEHLWGLCIFRLIVTNIWRWLEWVGKWHCIIRLSR